MNEDMLSIQNSREQLGSSCAGRTGGENGCEECWNNNIKVTIFPAKQHTDNTLQLITVNQVAGENKSNQCSLSSDRVGSTLALF